MPKKQPPNTSGGPPTNNKTPNIFQSNLKGFKSGKVATEGRHKSEATEGSEAMAASEAKRNNVKTPSDATSWLPGVASGDPDLKPTSLPNSEDNNNSQNEKSSNVEDLTDSPFRVNGKFRLENKMVHLTYSYHFDEKTYLEFMEDKLLTKNINIKTYSIVREFGKRKEETGEPYAHTHVAFEFSDTLLITSPRFFDYSEKPETLPAQSHCHIKIIRKSNWDYICSTYHTKDGKPYTNYVPPKQILEKKQKMTKEERNQMILENVKTCTSEKDVIKYAAEEGFLFNSGALLKVWEHVKPPPENNHKVDIPKNYHTWQTELVNEAEIGLLEDRVITWYVDPNGDSGKTIMANILKTNYKGIVITTADESGSLHAVRTYIDDNGNSPQYIIYNLPRQTSEAQITHICGTLEKFKDGIFTSTKYNSKVIHFEFNPQVIVFSNNPPNKDALSLDRWDIRVINQIGTNVQHRFHGYSASVKHEALLNEEKARNKINPEFVITKNVSPDQIFDIDFFDKGFSLIQKADEYFYSGKIAKICLEKIPVTPDLIENGIIDKDCLIRRSLTLNEIKKGVIYNGYLKLRDMTPEEKEAMMNLSLTQESNKRKKFMDRIAEMNRGKLFSLSQ